MMANSSWSSSTEWNFTFDNHTFASSTELPVSTDDDLALPFWVLLLISIGGVLFLILLCIVGTHFGKRARYAYLNRKKTKTLSKYGGKGVPIDDLDEDDADEDGQEWAPFKKKNNANTNENEQKDNNTNTNKNDSEKEKLNPNKMREEDIVTYKGFESNTGDFYDSQDPQQSMEKVKNSHKKLKKYSKKLGKNKNNNDGNSDEQNKNGKTKHSEYNANNDTNSIQYLFGNDNEDDLESGPIVFDNNTDNSGRRIDGNSGGMTEDMTDVTDFVDSDAPNTGSKDIMGSKVESDADAMPIIFDNNLDQDLQAMAALENKAKKSTLDQDRQAL